MIPLEVQVAVTVAETVAVLLAVPGSFAGHRGCDKHMPAGYCCGLTCVWYAGMDICKSVCV